MYTAVYLDWWARFPASSSSSAHNASGRFSGSKYSSLLPKITSTSASSSSRSLKVVVNVEINVQEEHELMEQTSSSDGESKTSQRSTRVAATATDCDCFSYGLISDAQGRMAHRLSRMQILSHDYIPLLSQGIALISRDLAEEAARRGNHRLDLDLSIAIIKTETVKVKRICMSTSGGADDDNHCLIGEILFIKTT